MKEVFLKSQCSCVIVKRNSFTLNLVDRRSLGFTSTFIIRCNEFFFKMATKIKELFLCWQSLLWTLFTVERNLTSTFNPRIAANEKRSFESALLRSTNLLTYLLTYFNFYHTLSAESSFPKWRQNLFAWNVQGETVTIVIARVDAP